MNERQIEVLRLEIGKLELTKNDYLVLKFKDKPVLPFERANGISRIIRERLPELANKIIVILDDIEIYVVHKEEE